ncbi:hypothetical protein [Chroococcus sp. FPU101]|uniref:hypothetical protein n=1 Tax=Chroococcus sp. FPU101 TaxID=1974212 RepID=UPI001A8F5356|nr:hypothetical protein [Chroococcus sp. FPU101]GFE71266.1 hypothetical protein CFPU101_38760 [Chroococcus sp. FPU101]
MQIPDHKKHRSQKAILSKPNDSDVQLRAIAYSMDALITGLYIWLGSVKIRLGGSIPEDNYPGTIHSQAGIALVLPNYRIFSTYQGSYDP